LARRERRGGEKSDKPILTILFEGKKGERKRNSVFAPKIKGLVNKEGENRLGDFLDQNKKWGKREDGTRVLAMTYQKRKEKRHRTPMRAGSMRKRKWFLDIGRRWKEVRSSRRSKLRRRKKKKKKSADL